MENDVTKAIKILLMVSNKSIVSVTRSLNLGTPANLSQMINNGTIRLKLAARIAKECGYKLAFIPEGSNVEDSIEINGEVDE